MLVDSVTLKLENQNNGWKGICVEHHVNGEKIMCVVCAIGCCYCYKRKAQGGDWKISLSAYWDDRKIAVTELMSTSKKI